MLLDSMPTVPSPAATPSPDERDDRLPLLWWRSRESAAPAGTGHPARAIHEENMFKFRQLPNVVDPDLRKESVMVAAATIFLLKMFRKFVGFSARF